MLAPHMLSFQVDQLTRHNMTPKQCVTHIRRMVQVHSCIKEGVPTQVETKLHKLSVAAEDQLFHNLLCKESGKRQRDCSMILGPFLKHLGMTKLIWLLATPPRSYISYKSVPVVKLCVMSNALCGGFTPDSSTAVWSTRDSSTN